MAETMRSARASSSWDLSAGPVGRVIVARGEPLPSAQATRAQPLSSVEATRRSWHWRWGPGGTGQESRQLGVGVGSIHRARSGVGGRELSAAMPTAAMTGSLERPLKGPFATWRLGDRGQGAERGIRGCGERTGKGPPGCAGAAPPPPHVQRSA